MFATSQKKRIIRELEESKAHPNSELFCIKYSFISNHEIMTDMIVQYITGAKGCFLRRRQSLSQQRCQLSLCTLFVIVVLTLKLSNTIINPLSIILVNGKLMNIIITDRLNNLIATIVHMIFLIIFRGDIPNGCNILLTKLTYIFMMLHMNRDYLGEPSAMIVKDLPLPNHQIQKDNPISNCLDLIDSIKRNSLEMMMTYLKSYRQNFLQIKDERPREWSLFQDCLLLCLIKINMFQLSETCLDIICSELTSLLNLNNPRIVIKKIKNITKSSIMKIDEEIMKEMKDVQEVGSLSSYLDQSSSANSTTLREENIQEINNDLKYQFNLSSEELSIIDSAVTQNKIKQEDMDDDQLIWLNFKEFSRQTMTIQTLQFNKQKTYSFTDFLHLITQSELNHFLNFLNQYREWFLGIIEQSPPDRKYNLYDDLLVICFYKINVNQLTRQVLDAINTICGQLLKKNKKNVHNRMRHMSLISKQYFLFASRHNLDLIIRIVIGRKELKKYQQFLSKNRENQKNFKLQFNVSRYWWRRYEQSHRINCYAFQLSLSCLGDVNSMIVWPKRFINSRPLQHSQCITFLKNIDEELLLKMIQFLKNHKDWFISLLRSQIKIRRRSYSLYQDILIISLLALNRPFLDCNVLDFLLKELSNILRVSKQQIKMRQTMLFHLATRDIELALEDHLFFTILQLNTQKKMKWMSKLSKEEYGLPYFSINLGEKIFLCVKMEPQRPYFLRQKKQDKILTENQRECIREVIEISQFQQNIEQALTKGVGNVNIGEGNWINMFGELVQGDQYGNQIKEEQEKSEQVEEEDSFMERIMENITSFPMEKINSQQSKKQSSFKTSFESKSMDSSRSKASLHNQSKKPSIFMSSLMEQPIFATASPLKSDFSEKTQTVVEKNQTSEQFELVISACEDLIVLWQESPFFQKCFQCKKEYDFIENQTMNRMKIKFSRMFQEFKCLVKKRQLRDLPEMEKQKVILNAIFNKENQEQKERQLEIANRNEIIQQIQTQNIPLSLDFLSISRFYLNIPKKEIYNNYEHFLGSIGKTLSNKNDL